MKKTAAALTTPTTTPKTSPSASSQPIQKLSVGRELADTTWRMAVPVLLFALVGILIDKALGSKPWVTLLGASFGFYVAALLIKRQIMNGMKNTDIKDVEDVAKDGLHDEKDKR